MKKNMKKHQKNEINLISDLYSSEDFLPKDRFGKVILILLLLLFINNGVYAQTDKSIKGKVTDISGMPLPGASIFEKGATNGTTSDFDGNFSIKLKSKTPVLSISYLGYVSKEIIVGSQNSIVVVLIEDAAQLD
jgi:hypothetical protein